MSMLIAVQFSIDSLYAKNCFKFMIFGVNVEFQLSEFVLLFNVFFSLSIMDLNKAVHHVKCAQ